MCVRYIYQKSPLVIWDGEADQFRLMAPFGIVWTDYSNVKHSIICPTGMLTDFASIPKFIRWLFPINDDHIPAATVHDFLYRTGVDGITRELADAIFLEIMDTTDLPEWKKTAMWLGVRLFGKSSFHK